MRYRFYTQALLLLTCLIAGNDKMFAQSRTVKGKVLDAVTHAPLQYASVSLLRKDSLLIKETTTDNASSFSLKKTISKNCY